MNYLIISDKGFLPTSVIFDTEEEATNEMIDIYTQHKEKFGVRLIMEVITVKEYKKRIENTSEEIESGFLEE